LKGSSSDSTKRYPYPKNGEFQLSEYMPEPPVFTTKPRQEKPVVEEAITRIVEDNNFPSRQAPKGPKEPRRKRRLYTTRRTWQFNNKTTAETVERFYKMADERHVPLCELLEEALDAPGRAGVST
jgi:hypothetical protein